IVPVTRVAGASQSNKSVADAFIFLALIMYVTAAANNFGPAVLLAAVAGLMSSLSVAGRWPTVFAIANSVVSTFLASLVYRQMLLASAGEAVTGGVWGPVRGILFPLFVFAVVLSSLP